MHESGNRGIDTRPNRDRLQIFQNCPKPIGLDSPRLRSAMRPNIKAGEGLPATEWMVLPIWSGAGERHGKAWAKWKKVKVRGPERHCHVLPNGATFLQKLYRKRQKPKRNREGYFDEYNSIYINLSQYLSGYILRNRARKPSPS